MSIKNIMTIKELNLSGVFEIRLETKEDHRGFFMRTYQEEFFKKNGINKEWIQEYQNFSAKKGTIRGLHFQLEPYSEAKLVRAIQGETLDVFVDLRKNSPNFGKWGSLILSPKNNNMIYIPRGFAHGLCSLSDNTMVICKLDNIYSPESECQIKWDDPDLKIDWHITEQPTISQKDSNAKSFKEFLNTIKGIQI